MGKTTTNIDVNALRILELDKAIRRKNHFIDKLLIDELEDINENKSRIDVLERENAKLRAIVTAMYVYLSEQSWFSDDRFHDVIQAVRKRK
jgi:hypothetical protein